MQSHCWYEEYPKLAHCLEGLQFVPSHERDRLAHAIMQMLRAQGSDLLDQFVLEFPMDSDQHLWYDQDPYLWLVINGLQYAGGNLHDKVTHYLEKELLFSSATAPTFSRLPQLPVVRPPSV